jgi:hypothetical protein
MGAVGSGTDQRQLGLVVLGARLQLKMFACLAAPVPVHHAWETVNNYIEEAADY